MVNSHIGLWNFSADYFCTGSYLNFLPFCSCGVISLSCASCHTWKLFLYPGWRKEVFCMDIGRMIFQGVLRDVWLHGEQWQASERSERCVVLVAVGSVIPWLGALIFSYLWFWHLSFFDLVNFIISVHTYSSPKGLEFCCSSVPEFVFFEIYLLIVK